MNATRKVPILNPVIVGVDCAPETITAPSKAVMPMPLEAGRHGKPLRFDDVILVTLDYLSVLWEDFASPCRHPRVVLARGVVIHIGRRLTLLSYPEMARRMGRNSHSSTVTTHQRFNELLALRPDSEVDIGVNRKATRQEVVDAVTKRVMEQAATSTEAA